EELNVSLDVINSLGQKVYSVNPQLMTGMHDVQLPTASWANGMYFLKLQAGKRNVQARLLVQH
ncbi:MAG TPA: T9SS type A sorting domain-containing protein, partial [Chitinophagaceae bacterium]|nr:T9SS type A sorting domain-containing protein [Chitinophagaceae bacterium]